MYVNNEVGTVQPIQEAARIVKQYDSSVLFHTDAVQGYGKYRIYPKRTGIDLLTASGHKIHGPKGIGFLYINSGVKIRPIVFGGEQQQNIRSGTENVPGIAGLGLASRMIYQDLEMKTALMRELKSHFIEGVSGIENTTVHGFTDEGALLTSSAWAWQVCAAKSSFMRLRRKESMYRPAPPAHQTIRQ